MRTRVRILCCCVKTLGKFFHSTLFQFAQLYLKGQVIEKRTIGAGQAKIIKLTITLNNFITLEEQLIPFV